MTGKKTPEDALKPSTLLRERAEAVLRAKAADPSTMPVKDVQALIHELNVYQIELQIQNEELRRSQVELAESRDRYSDLYEYAPAGYLTVDKVGVILDANLTAATMLGVERQNLVQTNITHFVARGSQDDFYRHRQAIVSDGLKHLCELQMHHPDGVPRVMLVESIAGGAGSDFQFRTVMIDITHRKQLERQIVEIASLEQQRIGQDLHDSIGQQLAGLILLAQVLIESAQSIRIQDAESNSAEHSTAFRQLSAQAERLHSGLEEALREVRMICRELIPVPMTTDGLSLALEQLVARTSSQSSVNCTFHRRGPIASLDNVAATHLFHIAQGALSNALRHAQARQIQVVLERTGKQLILSVRDDGIGMPSKELDGFGLRIMQNRAQLIGGILAIRSVQPVGTEVACTVAIQTQ